MNIPTRKSFGEVLVELGEENPQVLVLDADISKSTYTSLFANRFPKRFFNVGCAEQNEMAMAAGMSTCGKIPFVSTYAVFASMRACEQIRTFVAYPRLNVKIAVSHGGVTPGSDGVTHQATEDLGIMRTIPNMTIIMPADAVSTKKLVRQAATRTGPVYLRFTRDPVPVIYEDTVKLEIGKANIIREGTDATIIAIGDMVTKAIEASNRLTEKGINVTVIDMHTLKPIDEKSIIDSAKKTRALVTVEDHNIINGLGSAVSEVLIENEPVPMRRIGLRDTFAESGTYEELLTKYHLNVQDIILAVKDVIRRKK
ncbi:MAG: transketolase family protein [Nitrospinae bacterium]|nr:transketolase family protein [Nitrospinota bacterium]